VRVKHVSVSLDAHAETHDHPGLRASPARLERVKNLVKAGFKPQFIMTLMAENVNEMEDLLDLAKKIARVRSNSTLFSRRCGRGDLCGGQGLPSPS